jgi:hypothetical protein
MQNKIVSQAATLIYNANIRILFIKNKWSFLCSFEKKNKGFIFSKLVGG